MKRHLLSSLLCRLTALCLILGCSWYSQRGTYKLLMPGTYKIALQPGNYAVWYFWRWPTIGLNEKRTPIKTLKLIDARGNLMRNLWGLNDGVALDFFGREGTILYFQD